MFDSTLSYVILILILIILFITVRELIRWIGEVLIYKPIIIKNLDLDSFLTGCKLAIANPDQPLNVRLNPHELLGFKLTILMSSPMFLESTSIVDNYVSVTIGESKNIPHVIFNYKNKTLKTKFIESELTRSCCLVSIAPIKKTLTGIEEISLILS